MLSRAVPMFAVVGVAVAMLVSSKSLSKPHAAPNSSRSAVTSHSLYTLAWTTEVVPAELIARAGARPHRRADRGIFTLAWQDAAMMRSRGRSRTTVAAAPNQAPRFLLAGVTAR